MFATEYQAIGLNVLRYRRLAGLTQEALALKSGVSRARISDIERGKGPYTVELILMLAKALNVDYVKLFGA